MSNFEDMKIHIEKNLHFPRQSSFNFTLKFIKLSTLVKMFKIKKKMHLKMFVIKMFTGGY